jgi:SAM-dependent methyltransferase
MHSVPAATPVACKVCDGETRVVGLRSSPFSGASFELRQCVSCWYAYVVDPPTDYDALYDAAYYRGEGADPLTDYEAEMTDPDTMRRHEWRGILRVVQTLTEIGPETRWLDLGCGLGGLVRYLRQAGIDGAIGSEDGYARTRAMDFGVPCLTSDELSAQKGTFDIITSIEVIEHVGDPVPFLENVVRLLRPGGLFFFTTGNSHAQRDRLLSWPYVIPEIHLSFFEPITIERSFARVGLEAEHHGFVAGFDDIIRYKTVKNLPARLTGIADKLVPWRWVAPLIDRRYGVSAFPVGRKPASSNELVPKQ